MTTETNTVELATELTIAWLSNPNTRTNADDVPAFLQSMHAAVGRLASPDDAEPEQATQEFTPAVSVRKSLASRDHIISMIDGKPYRTLRRHLTTHGLTPDEYRQRYGLKPDYPMVAPSYSESRSAMAKTIGLGRKAGQKVDQGTGSGNGNGGAAKPSRKGGKAALQAAKDSLGTEE
jgi:predicted transcriptional regulator